MKNQALFSLKDKSKKFKCGLLQFLFGALRVYIVCLCHRKCPSQASVLFCSQQENQALWLIFPSSNHGIMCLSPAGGDILHGPSLQGAS